MTKHEENVDNLVAEIADDILKFVISRKPDIGFSMLDLTYSVGLVMAKLQLDEGFSLEILKECYTIKNQVMT